MISEVVKL